MYIKCLFASSVLQDGGDEDVEMGHCMRKLGVEAVNALDTMGNPLYGPSLNVFVLVISYDVVLFYFFIVAAFLCYRNSYLSLPFKRVKN